MAKTNKLYVLKIGTQLKYNAVKTNESLQKDVQNALKWESILESAEIH